MVRVWYMDDDTESDQRLEHQRSPPQFIDTTQLAESTGVLYFKINLNNCADEVEVIKKSRGYSYEDEITCSKDCLPEYEKKLKIFFEEHLHTDEEIRLVLEGQGYFDVRDKKDEWIRVEVSPGDLLILPAGIYHRFTLDVNNFIKAKRFFVGEPVWTPHNRADGQVDGMECRKQYVEKLTN